MASKSYIVARGQIEKGKEVVAKAGDKYSPKNKADADRLIEAGVLIDPDAKKSGSASPAPSNPPSPPSPGTGNGNGEGGGGSGNDTGNGNDGDNLVLGGDNAGQS